MIFAKSIDKASISFYNQWLFIAEYKNSSHLFNKSKYLSHPHNLSKSKEERTVWTFSTFFKQHSLSMTGYTQSLSKERMNFLNMNSMSDRCLIEGKEKGKRMNREIIV